MKRICSILLLALPMTSFAQQAPSQNCPDVVDRRGSIQLQQMASGDNKKCYISIHNFKQNELVYRDYMFTNDGGFMVFNSFGNGPEDEFTGAREFMMFPRPVAQSYKWNDDARRLEVTDVTGTTYSFDYEDAELKSSDKATVKVASEVADSNKGGVEISKFQGLLMDSGFTKGHAPTSSKNGISVFTDKTGKTCKVKNSSVFNYTSDGDNNFKFDDKALVTFLKANCPKLTL
ncbi:hypothetical protein [Bdellovibrio sp. NC01]|uniref:hypothetical protein n=1 Tax=Bdellovibrio sp. NC01 TaxID=2220073 RepID=UPI00115BD7B1|nr:hypothetical protein [Bdellovibrio sp. NC01]QDK37838.1 hypothetical protein DOE51_09690 [Bdellovibrio sp. NC01]